LYENANFVKHIDEQREIRWTVDFELKSLDGFQSPEKTLASKYDNPLELGHKTVA
jgi:hypothetical protein